MVHDEPPNGHTLELTTADDSETAVLQDVLGGGMDFRHSAISTADVTLPPQPGLSGFVLGDATIRYNGEQMFLGTVGPLPGPTSGDTRELTIWGPLSRIDGGGISISVTNTAAHDVIQDVWDDETPFEATVREPAAATYLGTGEDDEGNYIPYETDGKPLEVLQDLHDRAGMLFAVDPKASTHETPVVESFVPGETDVPATWTRLDFDSDIDPSGYANRVTIYGATPDDGGERPQWTTQNWDEIDQYGVYPEPDGFVDWDSELTTSLDCKEQAQSVLRERVDEITVSGTVEIIPQVVMPGYHYHVPAFEPALGPDETIRLDSVTIPLLTGDEDSPRADLEFAPPDSLSDKIVQTARQARRANRQL